MIINTTGSTDKTTPVLVWDVDDVLNNLTGEWFAELNTARHEGVSYGELTENPPCALLGMDTSTYLASLDDFRKRKMKELRPCSAVTAWFSAYGDRFRHMALTATPFKFAADSAQWVMKNFGEWIRTFHFIPSARPEDDIPVYHRNKAEFLLTVGERVVLIDDNETNLVQAESCGISCLAFPRPWNRNRTVSSHDFLSRLTTELFVGTLSD